MINKIVDLHIHSHYSDGTMTPDEILKEALDKNIGLLAISDHNILIGSLELQKLCEGHNIKYLSAVELDSLDNGIDIHILGYGIDLKNEEFISFVKNSRELLDDISVKLIETMEKVVDFVSLSDYLEFKYDQKKGGWKALHYFLEKNMTKNLMDGLVLYEQFGCSYDCVEFPSVSEVCKMIHKVGGKAILAHPGKVIIEKDILNFKNEVIKLIDVGLDGIECYYPTHTEEITETCIEICREFDLITTSGSDCHGSFGKTSIGEMGIMIDQLNLKGLL